MVTIQIVSIIITCICAYIIGSIPFSVWVGRMLKKQDLREIGVGNPGGFHACTVYGPIIGLLIMLLDFSKGTITIAAIDHLYSNDIFINTNEQNAWHTLACILGPFFCVIGHNYSIFLKFNGGQGVGIFLGTLFYLNPILIIIYFSISSVFIGILKMDISYSQLIGIIFSVVIVLFMPIGPPWSYILNDWVVGKNDLVHLTSGFTLLSISIALLLRFIHQTITENKRWTFSLREGQKDLK